MRLPAGCGGRRARGGPSLAMKSSRLLPLIVACALFVENMDSTVLSTSLPAIAADLLVQSRRRRRGADACEIADELDAFADALVRLARVE